MPGPEPSVRHPNLPPGRGGGRPQAAASGKPGMEKAQGRAKRLLGMLEGTIDA